MITKPFSQDKENQLLLIDIGGEWHMKKKVQMTD